MNHRRSSIQPVKLFICSMLLILMLSLKVTNAVECQNRLDIVIAVDTTSSLTAASFENFKTDVKGIMSGFTIGDKHTRLALVSISRQAQVVVNFDGVKSLTDFNAAVHSLTFSTDTADLSEGIKVAKDSVLSAARTVKISKILILVKDRRSAHATLSDTAVLSRVTTEAAGVKSLGAVILAVGIGGVWIKEELASLSGTDYLLFKNKSKALESVKSLNNLICEANCNGTVSQKVGLCSGGSKHVITWKTELATNTTDESICRRECIREFAFCDKTQSCSSMNRRMGECGTDNQRTVENVWTIFDYKTQSCASISNTQKVSCVDSTACPNQVADVIFLLDKSGSMGTNFVMVRQATMLLAESLNIGPDNVRVGLIIFSDEADVQLKLASSSDKASVLKIIEDISTDMDPHALTYTDKALGEAVTIFRTEGRADVSKFVFIITDGASSQANETFDKIAQISNIGATVYAIGIEAAEFVNELRTMTAPESSTNMFLASDFKALQTWSQEFSKKMCIHMAPPHERLCEDKAFIQSISDCVESQQQITKTTYLFNSAKKDKCVKTMQTTVHKGCRSKCIDPVNGNEYFLHDKWTTLCHEFQCGEKIGSHFVPLKSKCLAADGTCRDPGSQPFKCRDDKGVESSDCQCSIKDGKVVLVIDVK